MTAFTHLAALGVSMEQARSFLLQNITHPQNIIDVCDRYGVTNEMIAEIYGGVTGELVRGYFAAQGIDSSLLDDRGYERLYTGRYEGDGYDDYYQLDIAESGAVFLCVGYGDGYSAVYDENLNIVSDLDFEPVYLESGSYIVHASYSSPKYAVLNTYIPQYSGDGLEQLQSGVYDAGSYDAFYALDLDASQNVLFNVPHDKGYSAIYDQDLNLVSDIDVNPISLDAGSYIVHISLSTVTYTEFSVFM